MATIVTTTGTGTPVPHPDRAGAGTHVQYGDLRLQFDAGRTTMTRLTQMGVAAGDLSAIFLTHYHSDHLVGLSDILLTRWVMDWAGEGDPATVVAPAGPTSAFVDRMFTIWDNDLAIRSENNGRPAEPKLNKVSFDVPDEPTEVWRSGDVRVLAGQVRHEPVIGAVGYRVETPDGIVVISGDTKVCPEMAALAQGADVVVYEAMRLALVEQRPPNMQHMKHYHADTREIGAQAHELGIPTVMLTHLIPAPVDDAARNAFEQDMRDGGYTGDVMVCDDLSSITFGA